MDFSVGLKLNFGGGQPDHYKVDFSLTAPTDDGAPVVGIQAVTTMAGAVLGVLSQPYEDHVKQVVLNHVMQNGLWPP